MREKHVKTKIQFRSYAKWKRPNCLIENSALSFAQIIRLSSAIKINSSRRKLSTKLAVLFSQCRCSVDSTIIIIVLVVWNKVLPQQRVNQLNWNNSRKRISCKFYGKLIDFRFRFSEWRTMHQKLFCAKPAQRLTTQVQALIFTRWHLARRAHILSFSFIFSFKLWFRTRKIPWRKIIIILNYLQSFLVCARCALISFSFVFEMFSYTIFLVSPSRAPFDRKI